MSEIITCSLLVSAELFLRNLLGDLALKKEVDRAKGTFAFPVTEYTQAPKSIHKFTSENVTNVKSQTTNVFCQQSTSVPR